MAMFSGLSGESSRDESPGQKTSLTIIAAGMTVVGELETVGVIKIEGTIHGTVKAGHQVLVSKGGVIIGDVHTREVIVGGEVRGDLFASERVEVQPGARIEGDVTTPRLAVQEGGELNGGLRMGEPGPTPLAVERPLELAAPTPRDSDADRAPAKSPMKAAQVG